MTAVTSKTATVTLPTDEQILITREFDAPRHLVYRAWTEPDLIRRWWHANRGEVVSIDVDLRVGGKWRYVMVARRDFEVGFHGEYREIVAGERLVYTEVYEGMPDGQAVNTVTFEDAGENRTLVTMLVQHERSEHRDAHIDSGIEDGLQDALVLLEGVARSLA
jgi:uncharacterized protein YndB with AHSA1/START domain